MPFYYRKRIKILPGVHLTFSKSGVGISFGGKGFHFNRSPKGQRSVTAGIPGSGVYWRKIFSKRERKDNKE